MCVAVLVGCANHAATGSDASGSGGKYSPVSGTCSGSGSGSGEDLCAAQTSAQALFDTWAQAQGLSHYSDEVQNWLQGVIDTHPLRLAVLREDIYGTASATFSQFVLTLDDNGNEIARAPGFYIDRIADGRFLVDQSRARVNYAGSVDPLYGLGLGLAAVDPQGNVLWRVNAAGAVELSSVVRVDGDHWLAIGGDYHQGAPTLTYFDANCQTSTPPTGDQRACAQQQHAWCIPQAVCPP
jgi:hypothetical protein